MPGPSNPRPSSRNTPPSRMKTRSPIGRHALPLALATVASATQAQHLHLNVGAASLAEGSNLAFINGPALDIRSGWFLPMPFQTHGLHNGLYRGGSLTFTALPASPDFGGPAPGHAQWGARIVAQVESLQGPQSGELAFWDSDGIAEDTEPKFRIPVGATHGSWRFNLSEGDGSPGSDPYGHIHGRYFTTTTQGLYVLGLKASTSAPRDPAAGHGMRHPPSSSSTSRQGPRSTTSPAPKASLRAPPSSASRWRKAAATPFSPRPASSPRAGASWAGPTLATAPSKPTSWDAPPRPRHSIAFSHSNARPRQRPRPTAPSMPTARSARSCRARTSPPPSPALPPPSQPPARAPRNAPDAAPPATSR